MQNMKILKQLSQDSYSTTYLVKYKGEQFVCKHNGGLPKLEGKRLSESLRCQLSDLIENYFLQKAK